MTLPDRLLRQAPPSLRAFAALLAGALSALAMPPVGAWPVLALTLPALVMLLDRAIEDAGTVGRWRRMRAAFGAGWLFGMGYFLAGLWWIGAAFLVQAETFAWLIPFAVLLLPAGLALYLGLACACASLLWSRGWERILVLAVAITLSEWLRGILFTGFPWNNFGYALANDLAFAQSSAVVGIIGLCFVTLVAFAMPAVLFDPPGRARSWPVIFCALTLAGMWGAGTWRLTTTEVGDVPGVKLRILQPDLPQDQKFRYDARDSVMDLYTSLSEGDDGLEGITHLFWPEAAFPFFLEREPSAISRIASMLPPGATLVTGAVRLEPQPGKARPKAYNSIRAISSEGAFLAVADKVHLVPFGEYLPFQETLESLGVQQLTQYRGGFSAAQKRTLMRIPGLPAAVPLICYEAIFPAEVMPDDLRPGERPGVLLNLSNDIWFGLTPGPYQHFEQARLRAVEQGLPLIRGTNNGISAIVDPLGRIEEMLPLGVRGTLDGRLPRALPPTFYANFGNLIPLALLLAAISVAIMLRCRTIHA
ncbi:apolipoprotein N-acyltransferase [Ancylobacter pratisalsi]|uniref:Apolipoprotein N-acyltransferase n=1 Tax=Ancylobacter pratisalsi TaxID=1745854 RepID=A0A6P1YLL2_9HYPH|nr:apolipoprotein N-acyltransferase [Ancylobacter pratisalsi]QIB33870.1 apolipoprotein N-acyltransferase [Ancylobacter pratisalsi]